ncbi:MAG: hypothetical protein ACP5NV_05500 [Candidatus Woesearchaeota archaeon]
MALKDLFYTIFKSLNPESYDELTSRRSINAVGYFFFIFFLATVLMLVLLIPTFFSVPEYLNSQALNFERVDVDFNFVLKEPFYLLEDPAIRVEQSGGELNDSRVLITEDGIFYKSFILFGAKKSIPLTKSYDLSTQNPELANLFLFLLPSVIFWSAIFFLVYFILIILFTFVVALGFSWIFGSRIKPSRVIKIVFFSSTILILVQLLLIPFFRTIFIPVIVYWLLVIIILFMSKDHVDGGREKGVYGQKSSSNKKSVFSDSDEDEVPVVKKRKKSFEKENEGYVEWK